MSLPANWLVRLNARHFKFSPPSDDPVAYSRWEFTEGRNVWDRFFASRISLNGKSVLDLGCGPGGKTCYYASLGTSKILGIDLSADMIQKAEEAMAILVRPENRFLLEFATVNAEDLPFPDEYFDVITCSDAMEHFPDPMKVLAESARILKSSGLMAIDFAHWGAYNGHHLGDFFSTPWCHLFWSGQEIEKAVRKLAEYEKTKMDENIRKVQLDEFVERQLDHFHNCLNHISISDFEAMLKKVKEFRIKWMKKTSGFPVLWPLIHIPVINEFAVARNVYILEKL